MKSRVGKIPFLHTAVTKTGVRLPPILNWLSLVAHIVEEKVQTTLGRAIKSGQSARIRMLARIFHACIWHKNAFLSYNSPARAMLKRRPSCFSIVFCHKLLFLCSSNERHGILSIRSAIIV